MEAKTWSYGFHNLNYTFPNMKELLPPNFYQGHPHQATNCVKYNKSTIIYHTFKYSESAPHIEELQI